MLKLKFQYSGHLMQRVDSLEKILMLGKFEGRRRRGRHRTRWLDSITDSMEKSFSKSGRWWRTRKPDLLQSMGLPRVGTRLSDRATTIMCYKLVFSPNTPKALTALMMSFCMESSLKNMWYCSLVGSKRIFAKLQETLESGISGLQSQPFLLVGT